MTVSNWSFRGFPNRVTDLTRPYVLFEDSVTELPANIHITQSLYFIYLSTHLTSTLAFLITTLIFIFPSSFILSFYSLSCLLMWLAALRHCLFSSSLSPPLLTSTGVWFLIYLRQFQVVFTYRATSSELFLIHWCPQGARSLEVDFTTPHHPLLSRL